MIVIKLGQIGGFWERVTYFVDYSWSRLVQKITYTDPATIIASMEWQPCRLLLSDIALILKKMNLSGIWRVMKLEQMFTGQDVNKHIEKVKIVSC